MLRRAPGFGAVPGFATAAFLAAAGLSVAPGLAAAGFLAAALAAVAGAAASAVSTWPEAAVTLVVLPFAPPVAAARVTAFSSSLPPMRVSFAAIAMIRDFRRAALLR